MPELIVGRSAASLRARRRRTGAVAGSALVGACVLGGLVIRFAAGNEPLPADRGWQDYVRLHQGDLLRDGSLWFNVAGATVVIGYALPALLTLGLCLRRRFRAAAAVLTGSLVTAPLVNVLKAAVDRPRPEDWMTGVSLAAYPSGHVANLTVLVVVTGLLVSRWWFWMPGIALVLAMAFSRTYLNVHWLTDAAGGVLLGVGVGLVTYSLIDPAKRTRERTENG